jgi:hypothetical protein
VSLADRISPSAGAPIADRRVDEQRAKRQHEMLLTPQDSNEAHVEDRARSRRDEQWEMRRRLRGKHGESGLDSDVAAPGGAYGASSPEFEDETHDSLHGYLPPVPSRAPASHFRAPHAAVQTDAAIEAEDLLPPMLTRYMVDVDHVDALAAREKGTKTRYREDLQRQIANKAAAKLLEKRVDATAAEVVSARRDVRGFNFLCLVRLLIRCFAGHLGRPRHGFACRPPSAVCVGIRSSDSFEKGVVVVFFNMLINDCAVWLH